jgi:CheY-like chemotaxis protein
MEAWQRIQEKQYSVIFTDIFMPQMDGFDLAKNIRAMTNYKANIIAVTASILNDNNAQASLFDAILTKPVELRQIKGVLEKVSNFKFYEELSRPPLRVLVVDDQPSIRRLVSLTFANAGDRPVSCSSGLDAIEKLKEHSNEFDVVFIDRVMPQMDGIDAARRIRSEISCPPKIIIMSADLSDDDTAECEKVADGSMEKPIKMDEFNKLWANLSKKMSN